MLSLYQQIDSTIGCIYVEFPFVCKNPALSAFYASGLYFTRRMSKLLYNSGCHIQAIGNQSLYMFNKLNSNVSFINLLLCQQKYPFYIKNHNVTYIKSFKISKANSDNLECLTEYELIDWGGTQTKVTLGDEIQLCNIENRIKIIHYDK